MTLEQKQQTLIVAIAEMKTVLKSADFGNDYTTDMISEDIVVRAEGETYESYSERQSFVFDILGDAGAEDGDDVTEEEADQMLMELENALEEITPPATKEEQEATIRKALKEHSQYFQHGDHDKEHVQYWLNEDGVTFDSEQFRDHYFSVTNSRLMEGEQIYIWGLIEDSKAFEHQTINRDELDEVSYLLETELNEILG